jgi:hypothetical protein
MGRKFVPAGTETAGPSFQKDPGKTGAEILEVHRGRFNKK